MIGPTPLELPYPQGSIEPKWLVLKTPTHKNCVDTTTKSEYTSEAREENKRERE